MNDMFSVQKIPAVRGQFMNMVTHFSVYTNFGRWNQTLITLSVIVAAYVIRIVYPQVHMTENDMPDFIMAYMRLHHTSPIQLSDEWSNFFVQVLVFNYGYTVITLPYFMYEIAFSVFRMTITEAKLVYIHSLIGILGLIGIFHFVKVNLGFRVAIFSLIIMAVIPAHIGVSRVLPNQLMGITLFYWSLYFLHQLVIHKKRRWKFLYFATTFLYIGSEPIFMVGLGLHGIYALVVSPNSRSWHQIAALFRHLYVNRYSMLFIVLPILVYVAVTVLSYTINYYNGYIMRLLLAVAPQAGEADMGLFKSSNSFLGLQPLRLVTWTLALFGPILFLFIVSLCNVRKWKNSPIAIFLVIALVIYSAMIIIPGGIQRNQAIILAVPLVVLTCLNFQRRVVVITLLTGLTLVYSLSVVYNLEIGFKTTKNYGSVNHGAKNNDYGMKTLGYLIRSDIVEVSTSQLEDPLLHDTAVDIVPGVSHGVPEDRKTTIREKVAVFLDEPAAYYYFGARHHHHIADDIESGTIDEYDVYVLAHIKDVNWQDNESVLHFVESRDSHLIGRIVDGERTLIGLYSNKATKSIGHYDIKIYNEKFDREFGNMDQLPKIWLGRF